MTSPPPPLASNDLFGGAHLGQHAERIQAAQPFKHRRHLVVSQPRQAACKETRSDSTNPTRFARWSKGTKSRNLRQAQLFSSPTFNLRFSDHQTFNIVE